MSRLRTGRRIYYNLFSHVYDVFVKLHARQDAGEFVKGGLDPFQLIFPDVSMFHTPTEKSKLIVCRK